MEPQAKTTTQGTGSAPPLEAALATLLAAQPQADVAAFCDLGARLVLRHLRPIHPVHPVRPVHSGQIPAADTGANWPQERLDQLAQSAARMEQLRTLARAHWPEPLEDPSNMGATTALRCAHLLEQGRLSTLALVPQEERGMDQEALICSGPATGMIGQDRLQHARKQAQMACDLLNGETPS